VGISDSDWCISCIGRLSISIGRIGKRTENPAGPLQAYVNGEVPLVTVDERLIVPLSNIGLFEVVVTAGTGYTVSMPEAEAVHPEAFVTVTL